MRSSTWFIALACGAAVSSAAAQTPTEEKNFFNVMYGTVFSNRWSLSVHGGTDSHGNFLLQNTAGGERALQAERSTSFGAGAGFDIEPGMSVRLNYLYGNSSLEFRDDNGTGSSALDVHDLGKLTSHAATAEIMRFFLHSRSPVTPYASAGVAGTWWILDQTSAVVTAPGGTQQFRFGAAASIGLQVRIANGFFTRLEAAKTPSGNPFTGNRSFRATGTTVDEPSVVGRTEYRLAAVYYFGQPLTDKK